MSPDEYIKNVIRTPAPVFEAVQRMQDKKLVALLHSAMGIATEGGELIDAFKKHIFYGKSLDTLNLIEELGDLMWYIGYMCHILDINLEKVMELNIKKLRVRYPEDYDAKSALERDLGKEREVLNDNGNIGNMEFIKKSHKSLERGQVWCRTCKKTLKVDIVSCIMYGWPKCCGYTMTIDHPDTWKKE